MEDEIKPKATPRFGQSSQTDFLSLLKDELNKQNPNIKLDTRENLSKLDKPKNEKNFNSQGKLNLPNSSKINRGLAIERWFCDYPNKRLELRNDYDQENSKNFLKEKEKAFEKLNFYDDLLMNNDSSDSN